MPPGVALLPIYRALRALMVAHAPLTTLLASATAIYADGAVPQGAPMPYLVMGAGTQVTARTFGAVADATWGHTCTLMIKAVGQRGEEQGLDIMHALAALLYAGRDLTVTGYTEAWCDEWLQQPTIVTTLAGVTTREWPAILRVHAA